MTKKPLKVVTSLADIAAQEVRRHLCGVRGTAVVNRWYVRAKGLQTECLPARPIGGQRTSDGALLPRRASSRYDEHIDSIYVGHVRPATTITILILLAIILIAGLALILSLRGA